MRLRYKNACFPVCHDSKKVVSLKVCCRDYASQALCALEACGLAFIPEPKEEDIGKKPESPIVPPPLMKIAAGSIREAEIRRTAERWD